MKIKTPIEILLDGEDNPTETVWTDNALKAMKEYARQVAIQVRQECAKNSKVDLNSIKGPSDYDAMASCYVDKSSILSVDIEQFLK